jgi:hypothetical protein
MERQMGRRAGTAHRAPVILRHKSRIWYLLDDKAHPTIQKRLDTNGHEWMNRRDTLPKAELRPACKKDRFTI